MVGWKRRAAGLAAAWCVWAVAGCGNTVAPAPLTADDGPAAPGVVKGLPLEPQADPASTDPGSAVDGHGVIVTPAADLHAPHFLDVHLDNTQRIIHGQLTDIDPDEHVTLHAETTGGIYAWLGNNANLVSAPSQVWVVDHDVDTIRGSVEDPWRFEVDLEADDPFAGADGVVTLWAVDKDGHRTDYTPALAVKYAPTPRFPYGALAPDTLYAIPLVAEAAVGQDVPVVIATGVPAQPFQYMNGVGLTMPADGEYVKKSFDVGLPNDPPVYPAMADGIWEQLAPQYGFIIGADWMIQAADLGNGLRRWDFNVTPLDVPHDTRRASGALFVAKFRFATPGRKLFGFERGGAVVPIEWGYAPIKRTYYSDAVTEHYWGNIANNGETGLANSVLIH